MRILLTNTGPWGTGSSAVIEGVKSELLRLGHQVKVILPDRQENIAGMNLNPDHYHVMTFPTSYQGEAFYTFPLMISDPNPRNLRGAWTFKEMPQAAFEAYQGYLKSELASVIQEFKPDLVETHHVWLTGYVLSQLNIPYVCCAHNSDQLGFEFDERMQPYAKTCAQQAQKIFALSESNKAQIVSLYDVAPEKTPILVNGYDSETFKPMHINKAELFDAYDIQYPLDLPVVVFGGKLSKIKGIDVLLEANAQLQKTTPCVMIVFGTGELNDALERCPTDEETNRVVFMGHQPGSVLAQFYNCAEVSVLPSRNEGFPLSVLEAMGCGVPIVASRICKLEDHIIGETVPPEDPGALSDALIRLLGQSHAAHVAMKQQVLNHIKHYTWAENVKIRVKLYEQVLRETNS